MYRAFPFSKNSLVCLFICVYLCRCGCVFVCVFECGVCGCVIDSPKKIIFNTVYESNKKFHIAIKMHVSVTKAVSHGDVSIEEHILDTNAGKQKS